MGAVSARGRLHRAPGAGAGALRAAHRGLAPGGGEPVEPLLELWRAAWARDGAAASGMVSRQARVRSGHGARQAHPDGALFAPRSAARGVLPDAPHRRPLQPRLRGVPAAQLSDAGGFGDRARRAARARLRAAPRGPRRAPRAPRHRAARLVPDFLLHLQPGAAAQLPARARGSGDADVAMPRGPRGLQVAQAPACRRADTAATGLLPAAAGGRRRGTSASARCG